MLKNVTYIMILPTEPENKSIAASKLVIFTKNYLNLKISLFDFFRSLYTFVATL